MGGEVLELWPDRAARMEREAREEGIAQGLEQGLETLVSKLRESGIDGPTLESAASEARKEIAKGKTG